MISKLRIPIFVLLSAMILRASVVQLSPADNIYSAIRNNDLQTLGRLAGGSGLKATDDRGRTPLMVAAGTGSLEAMKLLLAAGADANASDNFGVTPLMFAARDSAKVHLLLDAGAHANEKSRQGQTALLIAASTAGSLETVRLLIAKGADPKVIGNGGRTGLIVAASANDIDLVRFFLDAGVNVNAVNQTDISGHTALMAASSQNNTAMVQLLLQRGADVNMPATEAASVKNGPLAFKGRTALMMAAPYGSKQLIQLLLNARANVNASDIAGLTPLMFAVASENQDPEAVKLLLSSGADVTAKTTAGESALDWARKFGAPGILPLLGSGAAKDTPSVKASALAPMPPTAELRSIIQSSVALLQRSSTQAATTGGCVNCHHQNFTGMAVAAAREKAIPVDQAVAAEQRQAMSAGLRGRENSFVQRMDSGGGLDSALFTLTALHADKYPADATTDAMVAYIMSRQFADGRWPREEAARPPLQDGDMNRAALAVSVLQAYASPALMAEASGSIGRARQWMMNVRPKTTDDKATMLVGLRLSGAPQMTVQAAAKALLELQHTDGGWGGNPNLESDAYATSEALLALLDSGSLTASNDAYQRGVRFLVGTRAKDGSWHVRSRAPKFQPYFESGFPYGHDQWISAAASARAVIALARALP